MERRSLCTEPRTSGLAVFLPGFSLLRGCFGVRGGRFLPPKIAFWLTFLLQKATNVASSSGCTPAMTVPTQPVVSATIGGPFEHASEALWALNPSKMAVLAVREGVRGSGPKNADSGGLFALRAGFLWNQTPGHSKKYKCLGSPGCKNAREPSRTRFLKEFDNFSQNFAAEAPRAQNRVTKPSFGPGNLPPRGPSVDPFLDRPGDDLALLHRGTTP